MTFRQYPSQSLDLVGIVSRVISPPCRVKGWPNHELDEGATELLRSEHDERLARN